MAPKFDLQLNIEAPASRVWTAVTDPVELGRWMLEEGLDVRSDGVVGGAIVISGDLHGIAFETKGTIRALEPERVFEYAYWSTLSFPTLPDIPANYAVLRFVLEPIESGTRLTLAGRRFPDDSTYRHAGLYWEVALLRLRDACEGRDAA